MARQVAASPNGLGAIPSMATGSFTSDGNDTSLVLGFNPRWVKVYDESGNVIWEKVQGDLALNSWKGGALDTSGAIQFPADIGLQEPGSSVLLSAALVGSGKIISWVALG